MNKEPGRERKLKRLNLIRSPEAIRPVAPDPLVDTDRLGAPHPADTVLPGPFLSWR